MRTQSIQNVRGMRDWNFNAQATFMMYWCFSFYSSILLGSLYTTLLMNNSFILKEISHLKLRANVTPKDLYFRVELGFN